ncbi:hypothetical protein NQ315_002988, partial [Exocentrus adspersus]
LCFKFLVKVEVCTTPTCVRSSMELLQYIDKKVDPCEDFYRFSCGNFLQKADVDERGYQSVNKAVENEIQSKVRSMLEQPIQTEDRLAFKQAKKFYRACINETAREAEGLMLIKAIFKQIGGWPTLEGDKWSQESFDWRSAIHKLRAMGIGPHFFFQVTVDKDKLNETRYVLGIHDMQYSPSKIQDSVKKLYSDYMVEVAAAFGAKVDVARKDAQAYINILLKLAKISEESILLNKTGLYEVYTLSELQGNYPGIPWYTYLNGLLAPVESIYYDDVVVVTEPFYLNGLLKIFEETSNRTLANFIVWNTLQHLIQYLPGKILNKAYEYLGKVNGVIPVEPRWMVCLKSVQERMNSVVAAAYIEHFFGEYSRTNIGEMILNIKIQFKNNLKGLYWLDEKSKRLTIEQLLNNIEDIGADDDLRDMHLYNKVYEEVEIYENKLLQSVLALDFVNLNLKYGKLKKPVKENWTGNSSFVTGLNVYYFPKEHTLKFPAGIFGGVYYQDDRPQYMNYGALGSVIAHEMSHILMARDKDSTGDLRSRWSTESLLRYEEKLECLAEQYGKFEIGELDKHVDTQKTRDEDMADLAGLKIAYDTYVNWVDMNDYEPRLPAIRLCAKFTPQTMERYVASYLWSPPQFRVNGPLQNIMEFATDFRCPYGSKMNPEKKCMVW